MGYKFAKAQMEKEFFELHCNFAELNSRALGFHKHMLTTTSCTGSSTPLDCGNIIAHHENAGGWSCCMMYLSSDFLRQCYMLPFHE
jgi:hypothetical protein